MELTGPLSITAQKSALRLRLRQRRQRLPDAIRKAHSKAICAHLGAWVLAHAPKDRALALYAAHRYEPDIDALAQRWLAGGRTLAMPRVAQTSGGARLQFVMVDCLATLVPSALGLRERWDADAKLIAIEHLGAVVVPCLAIASDGVRLGSGMGLYDRALMGHKMPQVGVTFDAQIVAQLPQASFDLRMPMFITERGLTRVDCQSALG